MDYTIRWLVKRRLEDGRLPWGPIAEAQDGPGDGHPCAACGAIITKHETAVSGIVIEDWSNIFLHPECFAVWDVERSVRRNGRAD